MQALVEAGLPVNAVISNRGDAGGLDYARAKGIATAVVEHRAFAERASFAAALEREIARFKARPRAGGAGALRPGLSSRGGCGELKVMIPNWSWLLISFPAAAHAEPPRRLEI